MLLSSDAIVDVMGRVAARDFYRPAHEMTFDAITHLHGRGESVDVVTVGDELRKRQVLQGIGGMAYLFGLTESVPVAANAGHYAGIVADLAVRRRLAETGRAITQLAITPGDDAPAALYDRAQTELVRVGTSTALANPAAGPTDTWDTVDLDPIIEGILAGTLTGPKAGVITRRDGKALLYPGAVHSISGEPGSGKAQPYSALIQTPTGPRRMGDLTVGDTILGADGHPQHVTAIYERGTRDVWELTTSTGTTIECCDEHLWNVQDHNDRTRRPGHWRTLTTAQLATAGVRTPAGRPRWHLPVAEPSHYAPPDQPLPVPPYLLGLLLGDGCLTRREVLLSSADPEIIAAALHDAPTGTTLTPVGTSGYDHRLVTPRNHPNPLLEHLDQLGLIGTRSHTKFIPSPYLTAPIADRIALLQGLLDTDGTPANNVGVEYCTNSPHLAQHVAEITQSLGGLATTRWTTTSCNGNPGRPAARLYLRLPPTINPFRLTRKADLYHRTTHPQQHIASITHTNRRELMRCIAVSNPDRLYLTNGHTPTHNSWFGLIGAVQEIEHDQPVLVIDFEDRPDTFVSRLLQLGLDPALLLTHLRYVRPEAGLTDASWARLAARAQDCRLVIVDGITEAMTMHGLSLMDNADAAKWLALIPNRLANLGCAVLQVDHVVKDAESRGRYSIGAQHKLAGITGTAFTALTVKSFGKGEKGHTRVVIQKDKHGDVGPVGVTIADFQLDATAPKPAGAVVAPILAWLDTPQESHDADGNFRPTVLMKRVSEYLERSPGGSLKAVRMGVKGNNESISLAVECLIREGFVRTEDGPRGASFHYLIRPFDKE